jgi:4-hydroxy-tetrahydrodipicolinate synthase
MNGSVRLQGVVPPLITPLTEDGEVHRQSLRNLIEFQIDAGVDGLWVLGSTAEYYALDERQRDTIMELSIELAAGRLPVFMGCIDTSPRRSIERARKAAAAGADAVFITTPTYLPVAQAEIVRHCRIVHDAVDLPLYLYNAQFATQTKIENATIRTLAEDGTLAGLKDSAGDWSAFRELVVDMQDMESFDIVTGNEHMMDAALLMGARGCIASVANLIPEVYVALYRAARGGDWAEAARQQNLATAIGMVVKIGDAEGTFVTRFFSGIKTGLRLRGVIETSASSAPFLPAPARTEAAVGRILERFGVGAALVASAH